MKKIFIAATRQNDGKTTFSLGLIKNLQEKYKRISFIKPIGQRYLEEEGLKIDEDSLLIEEVCKIKCGLQDMSPVAVEKGFTERYLDNPQKQTITQKIKRAFRHISRQQDFVVIEGTGHAGVGSVFDHSNASVAKLLGAKVIIVSSGGIGRPIDEIMLNKVFFEKEGVKILGAVVNKVLPEKYEKINRYLRKGLSRKKIEVLGVIPYNHLLDRPSIAQILEETDFELITGKDYLNRYADSIIIGAMQAYDAKRFIKENSLLITPGDREDIIKIALESVSKEEDPKIVGVILTGGFMPSQSCIQELEQAKVPVLLSKDDTYTTSAKIFELTVKIRPQDEEKINLSVKLIKEYVDIDKILSRC